MRWPTRWGPRSPSWRKRIPASTRSSISGSSTGGPTTPGGSARPIRIADYSGQTFLLAVKADGVPRLREVPVARYLELQVGYNTRGYEPNDGMKNDPHRRIYYGVGINLSRLLSDTAFRGGLKGGKIQRGMDTVLEYLEVPWTAARTYRRL